MLDVQWNVFTDWLRQLSIEPSIEADPYSSDSPPKQYRLEVELLHRHHSSPQIGDCRFSSTRRTMAGGAHCHKTQQRRRGKQIDDPIRSSSFPFARIVGLSPLQGEPSLVQALIQAQSLDRRGHEYRQRSRYECCGKGSWPHTGLST